MFAPIDKSHSMMPSKCSAGSLRFPQPRHAALHARRDEAWEAADLRDRAGAPVVRQISSRLRRLVTSRRQQGE
eukprot:452629-Pleurochrysis_carterae.AAC.2